MDKEKIIKILKRKYELKIKEIIKDEYRIKDILHGFEDGLRTLIKLIKLKEIK